MARKVNRSPSEIDKSVFFWVETCGRCHPGGGPLERDRDGFRYFDPATGRFGYQAAGRDNPLLDGDYTPVNAGDPVYGAPWDEAGVVEADCLLCHLPGYDWQARAAALNGRKFRWAATVGAGWARVTLAQGADGRPRVADLAVDYRRESAVPVGDLASRLVRSPGDESCWNCHNSSDTEKRGRSVSPEGDVHARAGVACAHCHSADESHNFAKGDAGLSTVRDDLDYTIRDCRDCHLGRRHERAPHPADHQIPPLHYALISCEACHVPFKDTPAVLAVDNASTGSTITLGTDRFLTFDPERPARWQPALQLHRGKIKPFKPLVSIWWGDLNEKTGEVAPIPLWKIRATTLPSYHDDDGDGTPEVNTLPEIHASLIRLRSAVDRFGNPVVSGSPALVKGGRVYKLAGQTVTHYEAPLAEPHSFSISHNVLPSEAALGSGGCSDCHRQGSGFFHRRVLLDPIGEHGDPVYRESWRLMGYTEAQVRHLSRPRGTDGP